jgi:hypothetical protein
LLQKLNGLTVERLGFGMFSGFVEDGSEIGCGDGGFRSTGPVEFLSKHEVFAKETLGFDKLAFGAE